MSNLFKGSPYRRRRDEEEEAGGNSSTGFDHENPDDDDASSPFYIPSTKNAPLDRLRRWRQAALVLNASRRFRYTLDLKREEEKRQILRKIGAHAQAIRAAYLFREAGDHGQLLFFSREKGISYVYPINNSYSKVDIAEDEIIVIQCLSDSPDSYHTCPDAEPNDDGAVLRNETDSVSNFTSTTEQHVSHGSKIEVLELIFFLANFIVELMSVVFDQLSSQHKPFLLLCLIMSISAVLISISEFFYKLIKEWDFWKGETNWRSWVFDPPPGAGVRVGFFPCITALTCAFGQFIIITVNYSLYRKDGNAPIKVSIWSTIFAFAQLFSYTIFAFVQRKPRAQACAQALVHVHAPSPARDRVRA